MRGKRPEEITYEHIRKELQTHLDSSGAPEEVRPFLLEHWARLMTGIYMAKGNQDPDWHAGWDTVNALLWTLGPKQTRADTMKMLGLLPTLLARLHEGCAALGYEPRSRDRLFSDLAMLHAAIAREGLQLQPHEPLPEIPAQIYADKPVREQDFKDLRPNPVRPDKPKAGPVAGRPSGLADIPALGSGDWVGFAIPGGRKRLRLTWVSPQHGMYLFANDQGMESLSLTRARLLAKFQAGEAWLEAAGTVLGS